MKFVVFIAFSICFSASENPFMHPVAVVEKENLFPVLVSGLKYLPTWEGC